MPNKTQESLNLAQQTAKELTRYWENWTDYLTTASRLYKYNYARQISTALTSGATHVLQWGVQEAASG